MSTLVLVIDDSESDQIAYRRALRGTDLTVITAFTLADAAVSGFMMTGLISADGSYSVAVQVTDPRELELPELDVELSSTITASKLLLLESLAALCPGPFFRSCFTAAKAVCAADRLPELSAVPRASMSLSIWLSPLVLDALEVLAPVCSLCSLTMAL